MKLREVILAKRNVALKGTSSITHWFRRHPDITEQLHKEIIEEELPKEEVSESIFQNGTFEELASVKKWIGKMRHRVLRETTIKGRVSALKQICLGSFPKKGIDLTEEISWSYKHPDRLTQKDVLEIVDYLEENHDIDTHNIRSAARNFLMRTRREYDEISGRKSKGFGKYAKLHVEKAILDQIWDWIKELNYEAYLVDMFMYYTAGTRIAASLESRIEEIRQYGSYRQITVYDKGRKAKYPKGKPSEKPIPEVLWTELKEFIGDRKSGNIFSIDKDSMGKINRAALEKFCPWLFEQYKHIMPNHFWRHMFFQHFLHKTGWNTGAAAALACCTKQSVEESYGQPPLERIRAYGLEYMPQI